MQKANAAIVSCPNNKSYKLKHERIDFIFGDDYPGEEYYPVIVKLDDMENAARIVGGKILKTVFDWRFDETLSQTEQLLVKNITDAKEALQRFYNKQYEQKIRDSYGQLYC